MIRVEKRGFEDAPELGGHSSVGTREEGECIYYNYSFKYFSVSDWLKSLAVSSRPAGVDQIWKRFAISTKMASMVQAIPRNSYGNREVLKRGCVSWVEENGGRLHTCCEEETAEVRRKIRTS